MKPRALKTSFKIFILLLIIALVIAVYLLFFRSSDEPVETETTPESTEEIVYYEANYDENIFENEDYLNKVRDVEYNSNGYSILLTEQNYSSLEEEHKFFYDYFNAIKNGNAEAYNSFFAEDYFTTDNPKKDKFTMQMIYDINVDYQEVVKLEYKGEKIDVLDYIVRYKILNNNGTFRLGFNDDAVIPQHYLIYKIDGKYKILNIVEID